MFETELKFQIPPERLAGVQQAVAAVGAGQVRLRARYFDTPGRHLAQAAMALRLRQEGERWVQTLKGRGDGMFKRLEHEVVLDGIDASTVPALDLSHHDGTPAGAALRRALGEHADALACRYETDVARTLGLVHAVVHTGDDATTTIELALDLGEIRAGSSVWPLQELEFELKAGPVDGLLALAADWVDRHGLWLDVRSKAERGERLASGRVLGPVVGPVHDAASASADVLAEVLAGVLANLSDRIDPRSAGCDVQAHAQQARIGIERLRAGLVDAPGLAARLADVGDVLDGDPAAVAARLRAPAVQRLWLDLIGALAGR
jgi:triphosphatase